MSPTLQLAGPTTAGAVVGGVLCAAASPYLARLTVSVPDRELRDWWRGRPVGTPVVVRTTVIAVLLGALAGSVAGLGALLPAYLLLALAGTPLTVIDIALHRLPDRLMSVLAIGGAVLLSVPLLAAGDVHVWVRGIEAAAVVFVVLFALALAAPSSFGRGDVKLAGVLGGYLGVAGWADVYCGIAAGFVLGAVIALVLLATRRAGMKTAIPFGPMLLLGALLVLALDLAPSVLTTG